MHQAAARIEGDTVTADPDYVLLELAFNDLGWFVSDATGLWTDLKSFLDGVNAAARRNGHVIRVLVSTVPHRRPIIGREDLETNTNTYNTRLRNDYRSLGGRRRRSGTVGHPDIPLAGPSTSAGQISTSPPPVIDEAPTHLLSCADAVFGTHRSSIVRPCLRPEVLSGVRPEVEDKDVVDDISQEPQTRKYWRPRPE